MEKVDLKNVSFSTREYEVLQAYADNDMNELKAARNSYMARGTISYHLNHIRERTGYNPRKFYDLVKLLGIVDSVKCKERA